MSALVERVQTWNPAREPEREFDYIDLSAVDNSSKAITGATRVSGVKAPSRARQLVLAGDVLVSTVRPNLNAVAVVPPTLSGATASTGFTVLRPSPRIDARYLFHWVRSPQFVSDMVRKSTGASYPAVSDRIVKDSLIPTPDLAEQRRIAAILDRADAIRAKRRQILAQYDEAAAALFSTRFGSASTTTVELRDVCLRVTDGTHQPPEWADSGVPFLFVSNITSGEITMQTKKYISKETWARLTRNTPIEVGDVLYSTVGSFGIPALVRTHEPFAFQRHIAHIKPDEDKIDSEFLAAQMSSPSVRRQAMQVARGVAQPTVNLTDIKKFRIVAPPIMEQRAFAAEAQRLRKQRLAVESASRLDDELFTSLQARAFRGEL